MPSRGDGSPACVSPVPLHHFFFSGGSMETVIRAVCSGNERTSRSCSAVACGAYFSTQLRANGQAAAPSPSARCPQKEGSGPAGVVPSASPHGVAAASSPSRNNHRRSPAPSGRHARSSAGNTTARLLQVLPAKAAGGGPPEKIRRFC